MGQNHGLDPKPEPWARHRRPADHQPARPAGTLLHQHPHRGRPNCRPDRRRPHLHLDARQHAKTGPLPRPGSRQVPLPANRNQQPIAGRIRIRPAHLHMDQPTGHAHHPRHQPEHQVHQHQHERRPTPSRGPARTDPHLPSQPVWQPGPEPKDRRANGSRHARTGTCRSRRLLQQPDPRPGHRWIRLDMASGLGKRQACTQRAGTGHTHHPNPSPQPRVHTRGFKRAGPLPGRRQDQHDHGQPARGRECQLDHHQQGPSPHHRRGRPYMVLGAWQ